MKSIKRRFDLWFLAGLGVATLCLSACTATGYKKSGAAAVSMQTAAAEVQEENKALEQALTALKELVNEPEADLRRPFVHFSTAVDRLAAAARKTESTGARMAQQNSVYLAAWDKQLQAIEFEHVRDLSQSRRTEVGNHFDAVKQRYAESQQAVGPLIMYLKDIRTALDSDLTANGLESLKGVVENAGVNAGKVQTALTALTDELSASSAKLSSVALQKPEVGTGQ